MNTVSIAQPKSYDEAAGFLRRDDYSLPMLKGGGMDIVDHMKEGLAAPDLLIDVRRLGSAPRIRRDGDAIVIDASATLADLAHSSIIRDNAAALALAAGSAATPQVRNIATAAGNLLQRPRCWYYRQKQFDCLKKGGARCFAVDGDNTYHAVFDGGPCHIVHPSNIAPALMLGDAVVHLTGSDRPTLPVANLFHLPGDDVMTEHTLSSEEVITHITMQPLRHSGFYAVKAKQSFDWPMVFAAVAFDLAHAALRNVQVIAGAVAPVPWPLPDVASALNDVQLGDDDAIDAACAKATAGARTMTQNAYKLKLLPVAIKRALKSAEPAARPW